MLMSSVKPFKSRNRHNIDLDVRNPNLKKVVIEILNLTYKLICGFIGWKIPGSSNKILPMKFYSSSLELSTLQTHIIIYRLGCRSKISITTFGFQIWIWGIHIDFIAIFRFERFYTKYRYDSCWQSVEPSIFHFRNSKIGWKRKIRAQRTASGSHIYQKKILTILAAYITISFGGQKWPIEFRGTDDNSNVQQKRPTTQIDNEKKILEAARKAKEILDSKKKEPEVTGLGLLVGQYR